MLGYMAKISNKDIRDVAASGPGLAFVIRYSSIKCLNLMKQNDLNIKGCLSKRY